MKKFLTTMVTVAMTTTLLAGCGGAGAPAPAADAPAPEAAKEEAAPAPAAETPAPAAETPAPAADTAAAGDLEFKILVKSFQSSYWQAAVQGVDQAADELGVTVECNGPNAESDIADQVNMLTNYINAAPNGIGLAACDQSACLDALQMAKDAGIPVVCFDSGCPDAPEGSVLSTIATDNYGAGATAADNLYAALKDTIASASAPVRIGEVNQESTSESIIQRGLGFIDKFSELAAADGKSVAVVGNEFYVNGAKDKGDEATADIIIEVAVPAQTTVELCATEASAIMNKSDVLAIFGSNQVAAEGILSADENLGKLGTEAGTDILAAGFDAGTVIKQAIKDGKMFGAVTQSPLAMGRTTVETLYKIANGESVSDIATDGYWYDNSNMDSPDIAPNLYD